MEQTNASGRVVTVGPDIGEVCWICLDGSDTLTRPCGCPRYVHARCLARWQLQKAGNREERVCRFCCSELPDWKRVLTPSCGSNAPAYMNVNFNGETYSFEVKPGNDGYYEFTRAIRRAFRLPDDSELNITFTCDEPSSGSLVTLQGSGAYDAAVHCACVSAAKRIGAGGTARPAGTRASDGSGGPFPGRGAGAASGPTDALSGSPVSRRAVGDAAEDATGTGRGDSPYNFRARRSEPLGGEHVGGGGGGGRAGAGQPMRGGHGHGSRRHGASGPEGGVAAGAAGGNSRRHGHGHGASRLARSLSTDRQGDAPLDAAARGRWSQDLTRAASGGSGRGRYSSADGRPSGSASKRSLIGRMRSVLVDFFVGR